MAKTQQQQSALAGLSRATATDPNDTSQAALLARSNERNDDGTSIGSQSYLNQQWAPYFESMQEAGERQGGQFGGVSAAPGLSKDSSLAEKPAWWLSGEPQPKGSTLAPMSAKPQAGYQEANLTDSLQNMLPAAMRGLYKFLSPIMPVGREEKLVPPANITGVRG